MAQVTVSINGKPYNVTCDEGQEKHVARLGQFIDEKVAHFARALGQVGDARLLVLASLLMADELLQARDAVRQQRVAASNAPAAREAAGEAVLVGSLARLTSRIEAVAEKLESTHL